LNKTKILNLLFGTAYYVVGIFGFYILFIAGLFDGIIGEFSEAIYIICFVIIPIIILILPIFIKKILKKDFYKAIIIGCKIIIVYFILIIVIRCFIIGYMSKFTINKWNNSDWYDLRYLMIDSLEKEYNFIGMTKDYVIKILGEGQERENSICYSVKSIWMDSYYYCINFDENNVVTYTFNTLK